MFDKTGKSDYTAAIQDFHQARSRAQMRELLARLTGSSRRLLGYDEVRQALRLSSGVERGLRDIPLDAIVGSVGRYSDFTRDFLPLRESDRERWARVKQLTSGLLGLPPIDVYQIGNVYFVKDGNHRVSVARQLGAKHIQAYVTEIHSRAPLNPDVQPDDLIRLAEHNQFLEHTRLDVLRPGADVSVSIPGQYQILLHHIEVHKYYLGLDWQRDISYEEGVAHWYDVVYMPVVEVIRRQGILRRFPGRTETDLYLWISEHRAQLEQELGQVVRPEYAASRLAEETSAAYQNMLARLGGSLLNLIIPEPLQDGPAAGHWRSQVQADNAGERLFIDLLTPINGREDGWCGLEQAIMVARREGANVYGLHVTTEAVKADNPDVMAVREEFEQRCRRAGVRGILIVSDGEVVEQTCVRAGVTDLVVVNMSHPPALQPLARLNSGFRDLIQRCPRPVLATPQTVSPLSRALLAYDDSPKAREALYTGAYLAVRWGIPLSVVTVAEATVDEEAVQAYARTYLSEHHIQANFFVENGPAAEAILNVAEKEGCDLLMIGGYGRGPLLEFVLGSTVNALLNDTTIPILICR